MMEYARIVDGVVFELIEPAFGDDGIEVPIADRFVPELVAQMVDITDLDPLPAQGWTYDGSHFAAPVPYTPTPAEIMATNARTRDGLLSMATLAIAPLQDAVDLDEATAAEADLLKRWKQYRVAVNRIDVTAINPSWPAPPVPPAYLQGDVTS